ncbi:MAG: hypothetical protein ACRDRH_14910 [Pseudonocardia sp.]
MTTAPRPPRDYFTRSARTYESPGSYADWNAETTHNTATEWHHTLGDVISATASAGLRIEFVHEHDTIPFQRYGAIVADGNRFRYPDQAAPPALDVLPGRHRHRHRHRHRIARGHSGNEGTTDRSPGSAGSPCRSDVKISPCMVRGCS